MREVVVSARVSWSQMYAVYGFIAEHIHVGTHAKRCAGRLRNPSVRFVRFLARISIFSVSLVRGLPQAPNFGLSIFFKTSDCTLTLALECQLTDKVKRCTCIPCTYNYLRQRA